MKAVNLLPESERPRVTAEAPNGASTAVLVGLGALLLAMLAFVFSSNQITDREQDVAEVNKEQQAAQQRASSLGSFGSFAKIKQTRVQSVTQLAQNRFDWERLLRELALVLPDRTFVSKVTASSTGATDPAAPAAAAGAAAGPSAQIEGCAKSQSKVAETMVRLRNLHRANDVSLAESTGPDAAAGSGSGESGGTADAGGAGCGKYYKFTAKVAFAPDPSPGPDQPRVSSRLGGGS